MDYNKLHERVFTHKCMCGNEAREIRHIGKFIKPCKKCGGILSPVDVVSQHKAWGGKP